jgi:hypothetical protein
MRVRWLVLALALSGCARGSRSTFRVETAPGFVEVKEAGAHYDFRVIAPDGVAVAVRSVEVDRRTDVAFWEHAALLRTRELDGYALLGTRDVRSTDGTPGRELVFGHDEEGKPFEYRLRLFVRNARLIVMEAGGAKESMEQWRPSVDAMLGSLRLD